MYPMMSAFVNSYAGLPKACTRGFGLRETVSVESISNSSLSMTCFTRSLHTLPPHSYSNTRTPPRRLRGDSRHSHHPRNLLPPPHGQMPRSAPTRLPSRQRRWREASGWRRARRSTCVEGAVEAALPSDRQRDHLPAPHRSLLEDTAGISKGRAPIQTRGPVPPSGTRSGAGMEPHPARLL